ncbi:hypothetical protein Tco_0586423 [Tanacetum coccineum]
MCLWTQLLLNCGSDRPSLRFGTLQLKQGILPWHPFPASMLQLHNYGEQIPPEGPPLQLMLAWVLKGNKGKLLLMSHVVVTMDLDIQRNLSSS